MNGNESDLLGSDSKSQQDPSTGRSYPICLDKAVIGVYLTSLIFLASLVHQPIASHLSREHRGPVDEFAL